ncbi:hypothetical protein KAI54_04075 [Candidatus Gracilibacteria bacterium]|nr:hypothetical protein [Candidatus Gracilibacteria bacterium]
MVNKSKTENLAKKIEVRQSNIVRWVNERYGNDAPKILATTFELKGIAKDDERAILEYLAFGNVETDMKASEKYFKANNKINSNETVETNEKIKAEEINKNLKADSENNPDDAGKEALGGFQKALKSFSEVFKQVSFAAGLGKLWEAVMHLWEAVIDGKAWFGGLIIKNIPHGVKESELCPNFVKEWIEDGRKDIKNKEIKDMSAVSALLKLKPADFHIVEDLKNITIAKLLGANADDLNKFTEGKEIDINVAQLATIKGRLVGKNISTQSRETSLSVYDFLKKKKNEKKYLN